MIVNFLVVAALVGGQPTAGTKAGQTAIVSQPTDYQVLPALGISGSKASRPQTPDAIAAKYSSGGAASWKSTRQVSAQQPEQPASPPVEPAPSVPPPLMEEPPALAPPPAFQPPATPPPAEAVPPSEPAEAPATPEAPAEQPNPAETATPNIDAELKAANPPADVQKAPDGDKKTAEQRPGLMDQDVFFRTPCVCIFEPWEQSTYYANTRSVFLWRDLSKNVPMLLNSTTDAVISNTNDLELPNKWGQEVLLGYQLDSAHALEVSYLWVADATHKYSFFDAGGGADLPFVGVPLDSFRDIVNYNAHLKSQLWNFELNAINHMRDGTDHPWRTSLFLGARIIGIEESFGENSVNIRGNGTNLDIRAENALYGGQLGVRSTYRELCPKLNVDMFAKGGVFGNVVDGRTNANVTQGTLQAGFQAIDNGGSHVSQAVEGGFEGVYKLRENIHLTFGYRMLFVARIVRATDQISLNAANQFPQLQDNADILYHGFTAGIRIFWGQRTDPNCRSGCCTPYVVTSGCCP